MEEAIPVNDFDNKVSITDDALDVSENENTYNSYQSTCATQTLKLLHKFLGIQQRRAGAYARLKRYLSQSPRSLILRYNDIRCIYW